MNYRICQLDSFSVIGQELVGATHSSPLRCKLKCVIKFLITVALSFSSNCYFFTVRGHINITVIVTAI